MPMMGRRTAVVVLLMAALTAVAGCGRSRPGPVDGAQDSAPPTLAAGVAPETALEPTPVPSPTAAASSSAPMVIPTAEPAGEGGPSAAPGLVPVEETFITHGDRSVGKIALTFDACQTAEKPAGYDAAIIEVLTETGTPATLFLGGLWMESHPTETQALAANPLFELGNHSWSHPNFAEISAAEMRAEIGQTQDLAYALTGRQPTLFRLPFGTYTDEALAVIAEQGLRTIQWDVVSGDPDPGISADDIVNGVTRQARNGSIVIMHMNTRGWNTAEALPRLIDGLRARGFELVTVSELLGLEPQGSGGQNTAPTPD